MDQKRIKQWFAGRFNIGRTLLDSFGAVAGFAGYDNSGNSARIRVRFALNSLVHLMLLENGVISPERRDICRRIWEDHFSYAEAESRIDELVSMNPATVGEAAGILLALPESNRQQIVGFLLALAVALGDTEHDSEFVFEVVQAFGLDPEPQKKLLEKLREENRKRKLLLSSSWGVVVAIGVILLFIITAKLLQSVIFGLIIACVLLPLEKTVENQLRRRRGLFYIFNFCGVILGFPLRRMSELLTRKDHFDIKSPEKDEQLRERRIIRKAVSITAISTVLMIVALLLTGSHFAGKYMRNFRERFKSGQGAVSRVEQVKLLNGKLEALKERFEKLPLVSNAIEFAGNVLNDRKTREELGGELLKRSGGMFAVTADIFGAITSFFANLLLTIFFALLFLFKLAGFCRNDNSDRSKSEYVIRMIFNGIWLPGADDAIVAEARRIIEGVFFRLRVWMKGYLLLILIDSTFYTIVFYLLGLPFFWLLGIIAGCGILLPYLGPVISCAITLLVTMASGSAHGSLLLAIIVSYLIYNGIIEQFILYPAVIGEALGLSTLETIIVVLLGAIFAGIPGMIFALPAASVAKFIIPQLYRNFLRPGIKGEASAG